MHSSPPAGSSAHSAAAMYMLLSEDPDRPLETRPSVRRTALLAVAASALLVGPPLYFASSAEAANPIVATTPKHGGTAADAGDDGPSGDDPDGTTAPGQTTSTVGGGGTSGPGTSAPGVTTAPGETSEGGQQTTGGCPPAAAPSGGSKDAVKASAANNGRQGDDTTVGQDTSTAPGEETSDGGHGTNTTAGETQSATGFEETQTQVGEECPNPLEPPQINPPAPQQPPAVNPAPQAAPPAPAAPERVNVLPTRVVSPAARLRAATGCPPSSFFARVSGRAIASVTFSLDGRRLGRVTRADANGLWKQRIRTRNLSKGKHRIVARVVFTGTTAARVSARQAGRPVSRTLSVTFVKCARAAQRPTFTG